MKVLHVFDHSLPLHSGYSFRSLQIITNLNRLGVETLHITGAKQGPARELQERVDGLEFHRVRSAQIMGTVPVGGQLEVIRSLRAGVGRLLQRHPVDLIHVHSPSLNGLAVMPVARKFGLPTIYELRALWEDAAVDHGTDRVDSLRYRLSRKLESRVLKSASHVTTICNGLKREIMDRGIDENRVTVVPNSVDVSQFTLSGARPAKLAASLNLGNELVLGFIGSFYRYEGLHYLVAAMALLRDQGKAIKLLLVGGGPEAENLRQQVRESGLEDQVIFTGRQPHGEIGQYYDLVDVLVFPRKSIRLTELVTPLKPLEAMAKGKLVMASRIGGHRELIEEGETGYLFNPDDVGDLARALANLDESRQEWPGIRLRARRYVETERNWSETARIYLPIYDMLVARRHTASAKEVTAR